MRMDVISTERINRGIRNERKMREVNCLIPTNI